MSTCNLPGFGPFLSQVADQLAAEQRLLEAAEVTTVGTGGWKVAGGGWLTNKDTDFGRKHVDYQTDTGIYCGKEFTNKHMEITTNGE